MQPIARAPRPDDEMPAQGAGIDHYLSLERHRRLPRIGPSAPASTAPAASDAPGNVELEFELIGGCLPPALGDQQALL